MNFLEYINKNFSPKVVFYDDDPTNPPEGEIHGLTLMTKKINEQVKTLGSIIVDFREKDALHRSMSINMSDAMMAQSDMMNEILERVKALEEKISSSEKSKSRYKLYYPRSDTDTETCPTVSRTESTSPDISFTTAPTRPITKSSSHSEGKSQDNEGDKRKKREEDIPSSSSTAPIYFPEVIKSKFELAGSSRTQDEETSSSASCANLDSGDTQSRSKTCRPKFRFSLRQPTCPEVNYPAPVRQPTFIHTSSTPRHFTYPSRRNSVVKLVSNSPFTQQESSLESLGGMSVSPLQDQSQPHTTRTPFSHDGQTYQNSSRARIRARRYTVASRPGQAATRPPRTESTSSNRPGSRSPRFGSTSSRPRPQRRPSRFRR